jgi:putative DNA primase/helicase
MVWADELPEGERLKENQVKKLTGSDEISARSPGESPFTFSSQAKLWLTTNHRPQINDDAMWRRIRPIPWSNVPETPDPGLKEYLFDPQGGLPAVLAWMVEGAMKFLNAETKDGLGWCKAVYEAAEIYRKSEDRIGLFFEEQMDDVPSGSCLISQVHQTYRFWAEDRGERPLAMGKFENRLRDRGFNIVGNGSNAILYGYIVMRKTITSNQASSVSFLAGDSGLKWER